MAGVVLPFVADTTPAAVQTFVGVVPVVSTTSFESGEELDVTVVPITMGLRGSRASVRVSFPYLDLNARTPAYPVGGPILGFTIPEQVFEEQGPGDVVVTPSLLMVRGDLDGPSFWGSVRIKAPTADEEKFLGTGEMDYAPGLGLLAPTGGRVLVFGTVRYNVHGDPPGVEVENTTTATVGTVVRVGLLDGLTIGLSRGEASLGTADPSNSVGVSWFHPLQNGASLSATGLAGFADNARTYGIALGFTFNDGPFDWGD